MSDPFGQLTLAIGRLSTSCLTLELSGIALPREEVAVERPLVVPVELNPPFFKAKLLKEKLLKE